MFNINKYSYSKTLVGTYKKISQNEEITHYIIPIDDYHIHKQEIEHKEAKINELQREVDRLTDSYEYYERLCAEYNRKIQNEMPNYNELKEQNELLEKENEKLYRINNNLLRINKEKANASRNIHPKKQHTGYCLIWFSSKDYFYYYQGKSRKTIIYESTFQTPFTSDLGYLEVMELVDDDFSFGEEGNLKMLDCLNADHFLYECRYEDLLTNNEYDENENTFFNLSIRLNGKTGYWEVVINSTKPVSQISYNICFPIKKERD